ncbi:hypothetical protein CKA55_11880 [Arcobacter suis]|uniref:Peptidoglycan/LOS O-acetylase, OafA/YrhL family n=1 Tax=Arcobacter suis CECT 7833 TaxID=663365 RepID=A0AAD0WR56_9BACT|nr:acyltransferase family protein [Arcobacter suis]AXX90450.1 putative peptidoglycan/LOS O-acetylase, OafA/YrhL family [Arcobacter suis CECT 7833]RWS45622.1 hypothetical protein CKA55_11880 [Arcobacter suis]
MTQIKEIQALRGIAVLLVILYHFNITGFNSGFVGVDIFFVISGFIITRQISLLIQKDKFFLSEFYLKRIKRLFPALFIVVLSCFIIAIFIYPPNDLLRFSKESIFSLFGMQNFFLLNQAGYFDVSAITRTLLHIWSLSIEEQFYLFWPFLLLFVMKKLNKKRNILLILCMISGSILLNFIFKNYENLVFYMLPFRAFEFLIGAIAFLLYEDIQKLKIVQYNSLGYIIIAVLFFVIIFNNETSSLVFILAVIFLTFLLFFIQKNLILSNSVLCYLGNISYSLYLIHWPILVFYLFYELKSLEELLFIEKVCLIFLSFILSMLSYYYIENKFRHTSFVSIRWKILFIMISVFVVSMLIVIKEKGLTARYSEQIRKNLDYLALNHDDYTWENFKLFKEFKHYSFKTFHDLPIKQKGNFEENEKTKLLVIGDSQAADFVNLLVDSEKTNFQLRTIPISAGCQSIVLPLDNYHEFAEKNTQIRKVDIPYCEREHTYLWRSEVVKEADVIVIAAHYYPWSIKFLNDTVDFFKNKNPNAKVYFLELKNQKYFASSILISSTIKNNVLDIKAIEVNKLMKQAVGETSIISLNNIFCDSYDNCEVLTESLYPILFDKIHFTPKGSEFIAKHQNFDELINRILK